MKSYGNLSDELGQMLNDQLNWENYSINVYLQLAAWCNCYDFPNISKYFIKKGNEESTHRDKFIEYLSDRDYMWSITKMDEPSMEFENIKDVFLAALEHERGVTERLQNIQLSSKQDRKAYNFMDWFLTEQIEEEAVLIDYIKQLDFIGDNKPFLWQFDQSFK